MASILLKEKAGYGQSREGEDPWKCKAYKGEFVVLIPQKERRQIKDVTPNYRLYRDPEVLLHADPIDAVPLEEREIEYLLAVQPTSVRVREFLNEVDKKMKMDLVVGDKVFFKFKLPESSTSKATTPTASVNGTIRYIGPHPDSDGIVFGIEIQDQAYRGKGTSNGRPYFSCGPNNAVFVAMDKITRKSEYPIDEKPAVTTEPTSVNPKRKNPKDGFDSQTPFHARADPNHQSKFKVADRVVVKSTKDEVFNGTVKWVGTTRVVNEGDRYSTVVAAVGVDVEKKLLSIEKHFPGMHIEITGSRGQELFKVPFSHTRIFFPEEYGVVLHVEEYAKQQQEASALKWEVEEANKFGLSLEEYRSQKEYLEKANKDKKTHHPQQTGEGQEEEGSAAGVGAFKNDEREKYKMSESVMHIESGEPLSEGRRQQEERAYTLARQQSQHGGSDQTGYEVINGGEVKPIDNIYLDVQPYHTVPEDHQQDVNPVPEGLQKSSPKFHHNEEGYKSLPSNDSSYPQQRRSPDINRRSPDPPIGRYDHHHYPPGGSSDQYHRGSSDQYRGSSSDQYPPSGSPPDPPLDPHHQFTITCRSMVCIDVQKGDPLYGVVKWIGTVPDYPEKIAGVEMEKPLRDGTDGTWGGKRFFSCPPGRGYFCPLDTLKQDTRYKYMTQSDAPPDGTEIHISSKMEEDYVQPKGQHASDNNIIVVTDDAPDPNQERLKEMNLMMILKIILLKRAYTSCNKRSLSLYKMLLVKNH